MGATLPPAEGEPGLLGSPLELLLLGACREPTQELQLVGRQPGDFESHCLKTMYVRREEH